MTIEKRDASSDKRKKLCVLLPALNEELHIEGMVTAVKALPLSDIRIDVLVVNDGSTDRTAEIAARAGAEVVSHPKNRGVGAAFRTGIEWALDHDADYLIHTDSDGQIPPEQIPLILEPVRSGEIDYTLGSRFLDQGPPGLTAWKKFSLKSLSFVVGALTGTRLSDISCGFRCMNRKVMKAMDPHFDYDYIQESLIQALAIRCRLKEIPIHVIYDPNSTKSAMSKRVFRYISRFLLITGFSLLHFYRVRLSSIFKTN